MRLFELIRRHTFESTYEYHSGQIGEGAFSKVFKIWRKSDGFIFALKWMERHSLNN